MAKQTKGKRKPPTSHKLASRRAGRAGSIQCLFLRRCGVNVTVDGEYKPFGTGDDRRVDGAVAGLPDTVCEMMLDFTLVGVSNANGGLPHRVVVGVTYFDQADALVGGLGHLLGTAPTQVKCRL